MRSSFKFLTAFLCSALHLVATENQKAPSLGENAGTVFQSPKAIALWEKCLKEMPKNPYSRINIGDKIFLVRQANPLKTLSTPELQVQVGKAYYRERH